EANRLHVIVKPRVGRAAAVGQDSVLTHLCGDPAGFAVVYVHSISLLTSSSATACAVSRRLRRRTCALMWSEANAATSRSRGVSTNSSASLGSSCCTYGCQRVGLRMSASGDAGEGGGATFPRDGDRRPALPAMGRCGGVVVVHRNVERLVRLDQFGHGGAGFGDGFVARKLVPVPIVRGEEVQNRQHINLVCHPSSPARPSGMCPLCTLPHHAHPHAESFFQRHIAAVTHPEPLPVKSPNDAVLKAYAKKRAAIVRLDAKGIPKAEIARKYGISRQRVSKIVHEARA